MATQARLAAARDRLFTLLADPPRTNLTTIHRDYYYANVLWDGHSLCVIDLDQLRIGDPALDVAHFAAHLDVLAYRQTGDIAAYREQSATFVGAYRPALGAPPVADRLPIYRAYTFLKLAATEVTREREGWRDATEAMARAACGELDA
jgi:aminoglycoside phosphotransferase (APT) family kinase protein